jgi:hypothetical protein
MAVIEDVSGTAFVVFSRGEGRYSICTLES